MSNDEHRKQCPTGNETVAESSEQCRVSGFIRQSTDEDRRGTSVGEGGRTTDRQGGGFHRGVQVSQESRSQSNHTDPYQGGDMSRTDNGQKVVLITGASSGIGEAAALEYSKLGYRIAITGRDQARLDNVLFSIINLSPSKDPENFLAIQADFEDTEQVAPVMTRTIDKFGRLDIFVNNAGYRRLKRCLWDSDFFEDFQKILQVNLIAATQLAHMAAKHLKETKGVLLNISSVADRLAMPQISYSVAKAGLSMLTKTLANALEGTGVRVVGISPGPIRTNFSADTKTDAFAPFTSVGRCGTAQEVADLILFLSSDKATFIHGCTVDIDGGLLTKFGGAFKVPQPAESKTGE